MKIVIYDDNGDEFLNVDFDQKDFHFNATNDLVDAPYSIGKILAPNKYSLGTSFNLSFYVNNKNVKKDMEKAIKENEKNY